MRRTDELRVQLLLDDADEQDGWWDLLEPHVWIVDEAPDVVLCDGRIDLEVPAVCVADEGPDDVEGLVSPHSDVEVVVAALWAVHRGLRVRPLGDRTDRPSLTQREQQVLELLALGLSNREIGAELAISPHTAKFHVQGLLEKLDATTRTEAAVRAARLLLI